jgi:hypothetical protein
MVFTIVVLLLLGRIVFGKDCLDLGLQGNLLLDFSLIDSKAMLLVAEGVDRFVAGRTDRCAPNRIGLAAAIVARDRSFDSHFEDRAAFLKYTYDVSSANALSSSNHV